MADSGDGQYDDLARAVRDLNARVQRLERRLDERTRDARDTAGESPFRSPSPPQPSWESRIGSQWLNRVGVVVVLFGVAYLLRLVYLRQWISVVTWIWLGIGAGAAVVAASEGFRRRGYRVLSLSL